MTDTNAKGVPAQQPASVPGEAKVRKAITLESLGLSGEEMEIFAAGSRLLFAPPEDDDSEPFDSTAG